MVAFNRIGYWSELKLEIIKKYAAAYSRILAAQHRLHHVFADRPARLVPANASLGVSVESKTYGWRLDRLRAVDAAVRFVSAEPLLGSLVDLDLSGIA